MRVVTNSTPRDGHDAQRCVKWNDPGRCRFGCAWVATNVAEAAYLAAVAVAEAGFAAGTMRTPEYMRAMTRAEADLRIARYAAE